MIFVDTSFWVAIRNRRDPNHEQAARLLRQHADSALFTSNQVRGETWTFCDAARDTAAPSIFSRIDCRAPRPPPIVP